MDGLSDADAFTARELAARGFGAERIAQLLDVDDVDVRAALRGDQPESEALDELVDEPQPPRAVAEPVALAPTPQDGEAWPPPVDDATVWDSVVLGRRRYGEAPTRVRVRWVLLWGKQVQINEVGDVWCPHCVRFRTTRQLGHPYNGCPVGLPARGGIVAVDPDEPEPRGDGAAPAFVDLTRTPM